VAVADADGVRVFAEVGEGEFVGGPIGGAVGGAAEGNSR
jgi:hypothetical protein